MRDFFFQIILFLTGAVIGVVAQFIEKSSQKKLAGILAGLLIVVSLVWTGYELGLREPTPPLIATATPHVPTAATDTPTATSTDTPTPTSTPTAPPTSTVALVITPTTEVPTPLSDSVRKDPLVVIIEEGEHPIGDNYASSTFFLTRFWLDAVPTVDGLLHLEVKGVASANPILINDNLVGVAPGKDNNETWITGHPILLPYDILRRGENDLRIESARDKRNDYDDFSFRNIWIEFNVAETPSSQVALEIIIDAATHHIGDSTESSWSVPAPEATVYTKFFELSQQLEKDAVLVISTYDVIGAAQIWLNDNLVGNLPGVNEPIWQNNIAIYIPEDYLLTGANRLRIPSKVGSGGEPGADDFMLKDVRLLVWP